jgi:hypothetical protein
MQHRQLARRIYPAISMRLGGIRAFARAERRLLGFDRAGRIALPALSADRVPVIFCTWRRLERLPQTLAMLAGQDVPIQALIWNNSPDRETVDAAVAGATLPVLVHHSERNIGGFGRFYLAREAAEQGHKSVVFIDDDLDFGPDVIPELVSSLVPQSLTGWWAYRLPRGDFWHQDAAAPGEPASYVGTGGMAADAAVFRNPGLFTCPRRFWFAEDLWLCYYASQMAGYTLVKSSANFQMVEDGRNQFPSLAWVKESLMRRLLRSGWQLPAADYRPAARSRPSA